ncbi:MAG: FAD-dependent oxidoreductase [Anaerolineae bacterium]|nr:FAD-dependent oxidoreductase [Anaerolineae bacterium]
MKVVIVGGVAGGASTAARLRRLDERAEIVILERGPYVSFANCGLPYHIGGVIPDRRRLVLQTPQDLKARFNVEVRIRHEVLQIDRPAKEVVVRDLDTGNAYRERYDKLVLSPGAAPVVPPVPGYDLPNVFSLRTIPDMDAIKAAVDRLCAETQHLASLPQAVVVGGGFIGIELAENLHHRGLDVCLVEMMNQVMVPLDAEMAAIVHQHLRDKGVRLALGDGLAAIESAATIEQSDSRLSVVLQSGRRAAADLVILAIGVRPENSLARAAGLDLGNRGTIATNTHMQSSDPDIYAIGDAAQVTHLVSGQPVNVPLAGPASKQGRLVADDIAAGSGIAVRAAAEGGGTYRGVQGTAIVKVFDLAVATTGLNRQALQQAGIPFQSTIVHPASHASYYPGATTLSIKLLFAADAARGPRGQLLGAQVVGQEGVDKRIDVLATALRAGMTVFDLEELELAYAPPYGSTRDPVNLAGHVAANILRGDLKTIEWDQIAALDLEQDFLLDVRDADEFAGGTIAGAINIPLNDLRRQLSDPHVPAVTLPRERRIVVTCQIGQRAYYACRILMQHGYNAVNLSGGYQTYSVATAPQSNF